jgi:predicted nucleotidyltransferase
MVQSKKRGSRLMEASQDVRGVLDRIIRTLATEYKPHRVILYGSQVDGTPDPVSDIDLLIVKDSQLSPYRRAVEVRRLLRDPQRRIPVDLIVITPAELEERLHRGDQFLQMIISQGKVLYAA